MTNHMRFFEKYGREGEKMKVFTIEELMEGKKELIGKPRMQSIGLQVGEQELFREDLLSLKLADVPKDHGQFWHQNLAKMMKERELDEVVLYFYPTQFLQSEYRIYLKRDGKYASHATVTGQQVFTDNRIYEPTDGNIFFPSLLIGAGAKIIGNGLEHPELLPDDDGFRNTHFI